MLLGLGAALLIWQSLFALWLRHVSGLPVHILIAKVSAPAIALLFCAPFSIAAYQSDETFHYLTGNPIPNALVRWTPLLIMLVYQEATLVWNASLDGRVAPWLHKKHAAPLLIFAAFASLYIFSAGGHLYSPDERYMYAATEKLGEWVPIEALNGAGEPHPDGIQPGYYKYGLVPSLLALPPYWISRAVGLSSLRKNVAVRLKRVALGSSLIVALILAAGAVWVSGSPLGISFGAFADAHRLGSVNPLRPRIGLALVAIPLTFWIVYARYTERVTRTTFGLLSVGITSVLLLGVGMSVTARQPGLDRPPATAVFLSQDRSLFRVMSYKPSLAMNLILTLLAGGDPNKVDEEGPTQLNFRYRYMAEVLSPNFATQYGLQSIDGYEVLQSTRQAIALSYMGSSSAETYGLIDADGSPEGKELQGKLADIQLRNLLDHLPVLRAFNVKYVLTNLELWQHSDELRLAFTSPIAMLDPRTETAVHVYEVLRTLPRVYLVSKATVMDDNVAALDTILAERVNPADTVLLENYPSTSPIGPRLDQARSSDRIVSYGNTEIELEVDTNGSGFLVINDAYYPGWTAQVDGAQVPTYVANGWVRAIPIDTAGNHSVRLSYEPLLLREGLWITATSLALCAAAVWAFARYRRNGLQS